MIPGRPANKIVGALWLQRLTEDGLAAAEAEEISAISYTGPRVSRLRLLMPAVSNAGLYQLQFAGDPANSDHLKFAVASLPE